MIDGSPDNSILNLIWDYNGFGRLSGGTGGANFSGNTGVFRLFNDLLGGQASWLAPAALLALVGGLVWRWRAPRTDRTRAALLLWGGWLVVTAAVFSFSSGVIHTYYTVALAPAIAALTAIGASLLWHRREQLIARALFAGGVAVSAGWAAVLLARDSSWEPWLTPLIIVAGIAAIAGLLAPIRIWRRIEAAVAVAAVVACLAGPAAYAAQTISTAHTGSTPTAGPAGSASAFGGFGGGGAASGATGGFRGVPSGAGPTGAGGVGGTTVSSALKKLLESGASGYRWAAATDGSQNAASLELATNGTPVMAIGGFNGQGGNLTLAQFKAYVKAGDIHYYIASGTGGAGGPGAVAGGSGKSSAISSLFGSTSDSSGRPGGSTGGGFGGPGGSTGGSFGGPGGSTRGGFGGPGGSTGAASSTSAITAWVKAHYRAQTVGAETVYNLSEPLSS
jgi:4-amino-4-deoxy-L-arabinose transferase-like glycosyltransferase